MGAPGRQHWPRLAGRVLTAAALGAAIGWGISATLDWSTAASQHECAGQPGVCVGLSPVSGLLFGVLGTVAACWFGFALIGVRPLLVTVPAGVGLLFLTTLLFLHGVTGGRLHPAWLFALVTGAALALLSLLAGVAAGAAGRSP
jgi:hypothetical protein